MRGCGVSRRYIDVCYCDMFSVVYVSHRNLRVKISMLRIKLTYESQLFANQNQRYILRYQLMMS